jgi:hypothetical protein
LKGAFIFDDEAMGEVIELMASGKLSCVPCEA